MTENSHWTMILIFFNLDKFNGLLFKPLIHLDTLILKKITVKFIIRSWSYSRVGTMPVKIPSSKYTRSEPKCKKPGIRTKHSWQKKKKRKKL